MSGLADLRREIDRLDAEILDLLARRFAVVQQVVAVKAREGLPAAIPTRVDEVIANMRQRAVAQGFPADTAERLWRLLIAEMIAYEETHLSGA
jgi:isochorismate pyruvate lyase